MNFAIALSLTFITRKEREVVDSGNLLRAVELSMPGEKCRGNGTSLDDKDEESRLFCEMVKIESESLCDRHGLMK